VKVEIKVLSLLAIVILLGMLAQPASAAAAEGTWDGGMAVQNNLRHGGDPFVAQSANGNKMAVWTESDDSDRYFIMCSISTPATGWSSPIVLDVVPGGEYLSNAQVGMSDNGSAIVTWLKLSVENHLLSRTYNPGIGWNEIFDHGKSNSYGWRTYRLAVNGNGEALLAHLVVNSTDDGAEIWTYHTGSGWESKVLQSVPLTESLNNIFVTLSDSGRAAACWLHSNTSDNVMVSTRTAAGVWGTPKVIDDDAGFNFWTRVGIDDSTGEFMTTYLKSLTPHVSTYYSVTEDGVWSTPKPVAGVNNTVTWASNMMMNRDGKALVVTTDYLNLVFCVNATMYDNGVWTPVTSLATNLTGLYYPEIAMDELGRAVVTWAPSDSHRMAATYTPGEGWSDAERVDYNAAGDTYAVGSLNLESGSVLIGYYTFTSVATIWVSTYSFPDMTPPELQVDQTSTATDRPLFEITGTTEQGATVDVNGRAAAVSDSGKFSVLVELNDGANVLSVVAEDAAGNTANVSLTVTYNDPVPGLQEKIDSVGSTAMIMGILGVVGLVIAIAALAMVLLRRKR